MFKRNIYRTILKYLTPAGGNKITVIDIGAGVGQYGCFFRSQNAQLDWRGYDGAENVESFTSGWVKWIDVTDVSFDTITPPGFVADWVMSLEVGEHISSNATESMIDLLHKYNKNGVVLSWAVPGQDGHSHINLKPNSEVVAMMAKRGYSQDKWCLDFQNEGRVLAQYGWFKNTFMVFKRGL